MSGYQVLLDKIGEIKMLPDDLKSLNDKIEADKNWSFWCLQRFENSSIVLFRGGILLWELITQALITVLEIWLPVWSIAIAFFIAMQLLWVSVMLAKMVFLGSAFPLPLMAFAPFVMIVDTLLGIAELVPNFVTKSGKHHTVRVGYAYLLMLSSITLALTIGVSSYHLSGWWLFVPLIIGAVIGFTLAVSLPALWQFIKVFLNNVLWPALVDVGQLWRFVFSSLLSGPVVVFSLLSKRDWLKEFFIWIHSVDNVKPEDTQVHSASYYYTDLLALAYYPLIMFTFVLGFMLDYMGKFSVCTWLGLPLMTGTFATFAASGFIVMLSVPLIVFVTPALFQFAIAFMKHLFNAKRLDDFHTVRISVLTSFLNAMQTLFFYLWNPIVYGIAFKKLYDHFHAKRTTLNENNSPRNDSEGLPELFNYNVMVVKGEQDTHEVNMNKGEKYLTFVMLINGLDDSLKEKFKCCNVNDNEKLLSINKILACFYGESKGDLVPYTYGMLIEFMRSDKDKIEIVDNTKNTYSKLQTTLDLKMLKNELGLAPYIKVYGNKDIGEELKDKGFYFALKAVFE